MLCWSGSNAHIKQYSPQPALRSSSGYHRQDHVGRIVDLSIYDDAFGTKRPYTTYWLLTVWNGNR
jgi:hypothetical protein